MFGNKKKKDEKKTKGDTGLPKVKKTDANGDKQSIPKGYKATVSKTGTIIAVSRTTGQKGEPLAEKAPKKPAAAAKSPAAKKQLRTKKIQFNKTFSNGSKVKAEGYAYKTANGIDVALHKEGEFWRATELTSGKLVTLDDNLTVEAVKAEVEKRSPTILKLLQQQQTAKPQKAAKTKANTKPKTTDNPVKEPKTVKKPKAAPKAATSAKKLEAVKKVEPKRTTINKPVDELKHNDEFENDTSDVGKIIVIKGKQKEKKPRKRFRRLKRVSSSGGYTVWDARTGKTFATQEEALGYMLEVFALTGEAVPISPTNRKVTHTYKTEDEEDRRGK